MPDRPERPKLARMIRASKSTQIAESANLEHALIRRCLAGMIDPFDKAERWRSRAAELRTIAKRTREPDARAGLLEIADGLDHHSRALENMAVRLHCTGRVFRGSATEVVAEAEAVD